MVQLFRMFWQNPKGVTYESNFTFVNGPSTWEAIEYELVQLKGCYGTYWDWRLEQA